MNEDIKTMVAMLATWSFVEHRLKAGEEMPHEVMCKYAEYTAHGLFQLISSASQREGIDEKEVQEEMQGAIGAILELEEEVMGGGLH